MNNQREKFEEWLAKNPDARFWNASDAMFAAFIGGAALSQPATAPSDFDVAFTAATAVIP